MMKKTAKVKVEEDSCDCGCGETKSDNCGPQHNASGAVYGFGFIGAAVFYIGHATTFWTGVVGLLKAIVWPAIVVYKIIDFLK